MPDGAPPANDSSPRSWTALVLVVPEARVDDAVGLLAAQRPGVELQDDIPGHKRLIVYLDESETREGVRSEMPALLARLELDPEACGMEFVRVADERWVERYVESLKPFPLGRGFVVLPRELAGDAEGRVPIRLEPGQAFGTGEHPTTRLCAAILERAVEPDSEWLDLGCGTAILALVAAHLGARRVLAVDNDPEALRVAHGIVRRNGLADAIELSLAERVPETFGELDGVVCNISASFMRAHAQELARVLCAAGVVVASGFLCEDIEAIALALDGAGLRVERRLEDGEWAALVARKRTAV
ncbi:MAG: methyltransferase domain-containing protein [bacterium]|nr:methyltransferase domain-containing protein [bacterium]